MGCGNRGKKVDELNRGTAGTDGEVDCPLYMLHIRSYSNCAAAAV